MKYFLYSRYSHPHFIIITMCGWAWIKNIFPRWFEFISMKEHKYDDIISKMLCRYFFIVHDIKTRCYNKNEPAFFMNMIGESFLFSDIFIGKTISTKLSWEFKSFLYVLDICPLVSIKWLICHHHLDINGRLGKAISRYKGWSSRPIPYNISCIIVWQSISEFTCFRGAPKDIFWRTSHRTTSRRFCPEMNNFLHIMVSEKAVTSSRWFEDLLTELQEKSRRSVWGYFTEIWYLHMGMIRIWVR